MCSAAVGDQGRPSVLSAATTEPHWLPGDTALQHTAWAVWAGGSSLLFVRMHPHPGGCTLLSAMGALPWQGNQALSKPAKAE